MSLVLKDRKVDFYLAVAVGHLMTEFSGSRGRWWGDVTVVKLTGEGVEVLCLPDE